MLRFGTVMAVGLSCAAVAVGLSGQIAGVNAQNPPGSPAPLSADLTALQGNWKPLSILFEGKPQMVAEDMKKVTAVFDQAEYHLYYADKSKEPPTVLKLAVLNIVLDPSSNPKSFTFEFTSGNLKGQKRHGIYEVAGNELKLCYGPLDKPRPVQFAAPLKSGYFLEVWARQAVK